ncbi:P-loop containing nucleoside triphosphate hydrolase protein, partial [Aspergillus costaricaensis CBS 115574]
PSGVGEDALIKKLFDLHPDTFAFTVSHSTRAPRVGEIHGKNYFSIDKAMFGDLISQDAFVKYATFGGNQYGTSKRTISDQMEKGPVVVLDIKMNGVKQ